MSDINRWTGPSGLTYYNENDPQWLWYYLQTNGGLSDDALAGLFGNLYQESHCCPFELEGWETQYEKCLDFVINNVRTLQTAQQFANQGYGSGKGFGLAQWTEQSRKKSLYNWPNAANNTHYLLGDMVRDAEYLLHDLQTWPTHTSVKTTYWDAQNKTVWQWLTTPNVSVYDSMMAVLMLYEVPFSQWNPPDSQIDREVNVRSNYATKVPQDLAGYTPTPPTPPTPTAGIPVWMLFKLRERGDI